MTFRLDVGWRRKTLKVAGARYGCNGPGPSAAGNWRPVPRTRAPRPASARRSDLSAGMLDNARDRSTRSCRLTPGFPCHPKRARVDGSSTCGLRVAPTLWNLGDPASPKWREVLRPGGSARAARKWSAPTNPFLAFGHRFYFGRVVPVDRSTPFRRLRRTNTCRGPSRTCPRLPSWWAQIERAGFVHVQRKTFVGWHRPTPHRSPGRLMDLTKAPRRGCSMDDFVLVGGRDGGFVRAGACAAPHRPSRRTGRGCDR